LRSFLECAVVGSQGSSSILIILIFVLFLRVAVVETVRIRAHAGHPIVIYELSTEQVAAFFAFADGPSFPVVCFRLNIHDLVSGSLARKWIIPAN
jgi:hypothetical protein